MGLTQSPSCHQWSKTVHICSKSNLYVYKPHQNYLCIKGIGKSRHDTANTLKFLSIRVVTSHEKWTVPATKGTFLYTSQPVYSIIKNLLLCSKNELSTVLKTTFLQL